MTVMLLEWVFTASFLILAVLGLRAAFGRRVNSRLRYALWLVVLVWLLVPVQLFTSPIAGTWVFAETDPEPDQPGIVEQNPVTPPANQTPAASVGTGVGTGQNVPVSDDTPPGNVLAPPALPEAPNPPEAPEAPDLRNPPGWLALLGWAWLAGSGVMALGLIWANGRFARRLRRVRIPLAAECPLPVYVAVGLPSPCLFGVLRPAIYVTPECAADPAMLRHVAAHEYTHFRQGDHLWSVLRCGALAVHWWNPLVWLAVGLSRRDGELACDEGALKRLGDGERLAYGNTLLALVTAKPGPVDLLRCATTMAGDKKSLKERFLRIAKAPKQLMWAAVAVVLVTALACVVAFGQKAEEKPAARDPVELPPADLAFALEYGEDGKPFVRIEGQVEDRVVKDAVWYPEGNAVLFGALAEPPDEAQGPELSAAYQFSTGWAHMGAGWADEARTSVTVSTINSAALLSGHMGSGYWIFTVELSGDSGTVASREYSDWVAKPENQAPPDEEAVEAARYAAKLLTAAEDYYKNAAAGNQTDLAFDWDGTPALLVNATTMDVRPDLNRNGVPETITVGRVSGLEQADEARACEDDSRWALGLGVVVKEGDEVLWYDFAANIHAGEHAILLYTKDGQHYLMEFDIHGGMGHGNGRYRIFTLENGKENTVREGGVDFDYVSVPGVGADVRENFDPEAVSAFVEEADSLLADCVVLADTSYDFWPDPPLRVDLRWLENYAFGFQWSAQLTTLENLTRFKLAGEAPAYARDLDGDMRQELIQRSVITGETAGAQGQRVEIWRDEKMIWSDEAYYNHADYNAVFLCTLDGKDYLLRYNPTMYQGGSNYSYKLFTLTRSGEEQTVREGSVAFTMNYFAGGEFGGPGGSEFVPEDIAAFMDEINDLLAHSVQLINTDAGLLYSFEREGRLYDSLSWLDGWEPMFTRDPSKSLLENLWAFKEAMTAENYAETPQLRSLDEEDEFGYVRHIQLTYRDRYVQFDGLWRERVQREVEPQVLDLNGDGRDEIIFELVEDGSAGTWMEQLYLFDADTLEQYDTTNLTERIIAQIQSTGDEEYFYLSAPGMERVAISKQDTPWEYPEPLMDALMLGELIRYSIEDGRLFGYFGCYASFGLNRCGEVRVSLEIVRDGIVTASSFEYVPEQFPANSPAARSNA